MKRNKFLSICILVFLLLSSSLFLACSTLKHREAREDMIMLMMLKDLSAMNASNNQQNMMQNQ